MNQQATADEIQAAAHEYRRQCYAETGRWPKFNQILEWMASRYDLSGYTVLPGTSGWTRVLSIEGDELRRQYAEQLRVKELEAVDLAHRWQRFQRRVRSGEVEAAVARHIAKRWPGYRVEHSHSAVGSLSFYVVDDNTGIAVLKISDHNTLYQQLEHRTPFINLSLHPSLTELKRAIDAQLSDIQETVYVAPQ